MGDWSLARDVCMARNAGGRRAAKGAWIRAEGPAKRRRSNPVVAVMQGAEC